MFDLTNKVALVTGGAVGIGFACIQEFLRNGVQGVVIVDINETNGKTAVQKLEDEFGKEKATFIKADVTKADKLEGAFQQALARWKTIDILLNNAGVFNDAKWELEIAINVNALVQSTYFGMQYMGKEKGGNGGIIINVASNFGLEVISGGPVYVGSKHFVLGFSRAMGTPYHFNRTGVKVLVLCPGYTHTSLAKNSVDNGPAFLAPDVGNELRRELSTAKGQTVETVGRAIITVVTKGENGSVWVVEEGEIYEVEIPNKKLLKKH